MLCESILERQDSVTRLIALLACLCCCTSCAQEPAPDQQAASLEVLAPTAGVSVQKLTNEKTSLVPERMVGERKVTRRWILNRKFIEEKATTTFKGFPRGESLAIYSFDEHNGVFRWWVYDTFGVASEFVGSWNAKDRSIEWKMAEPRSDGYVHTAKEHMRADGTIEWESKGTQGDGTLAVYQKGRTTSPPTNESP